MIATISSKITGNSSRNQDCLECRIVSGCGLIGAGLYVTHHSQKFQNSIGKLLMYSAAGGLVVLGTTRLLNLPPFRHPVSASINEKQ